MISTGVVVTLVLFMAGLIYQAGRLSQRVEYLERWREEFRAEYRQSMATVTSHLERMESMIQGIRG
ncbi:MAG TPA: hypothetical protein DCP69_12820 [Candidatus Omnitrophica bacterium]|nr:hypothetical protein [Candidatus Omnitrophota bacterium]